MPAAAAAAVAAQGMFWTNLTDASSGNDTAAPGAPCPGRAVHVDPRLTPD